MDYKVIFNDLSKIKNILNELLKSSMNSDIQIILDNLKNDSFKKVIGIQYIYLYSKTLNILHSNKSIKIITLEENLKLMENRKINEVIGVLNKLGYIDLLLVLLNLFLLLVLLLLLFFFFISILILILILIIIMFF